MNLGLNIIIKQKARRSKNGLSRFLLILLFFFTSAHSYVHGFQGIMPTSFGARQAGMGGAFQAVGGSVMDLESNPSHLARLTTPKWEFGTSIHFAKIEYSDSFIDQDPNLSYRNTITETPRAVFPYVGYIQPVTDRLGIGFALYMQGGGGGSFSNITRVSPGKQTLNETLGGDVPFGTERKIQEDLKFKFMLTKLTVGAGYRFGNLSVGIGLDLAYAFMEMKKTNLDLSRTVELPRSISYNSDPAYSYGGKLGFSYDLSSNIRIAYSYTLRNVLHMDGQMKIEAEDPIFKNGSRVSRYMVWPDRHIFGISYRKYPWIFDFDVKFIPWSQSFRTNRFILDQPLLTTPIGLESNVMQMNFRWRDQYCFALGAEYEWKYGFRFRAGYSYAKTPMTPQGLNPMLGTTNEHHLAGGLGYYSVNGSAIHLAVEYAFPKSMRGSGSSDWALSHSIFSDKEIQLAQFQFNKSVSVLSVSLGIEKNI
ncbi:OmpP1/FadL family transporter [Leptospira licerasiae]|uniref:OmpP1/FadL family transporter n=1 Tax=Leptospira licerasiae TaxID=447106 RepID=UPI0030190AA5